MGTIKGVYPPISVSLHTVHRPVYCMEHPILLDCSVCVGGYLCRVWLFTELGVYSQYCRCLF